MTDLPCGLPHYTYPFSRCNEPTGHDGPHAAPLIIDAAIPPCGALSWDGATAPDPHTVGHAPHFTALPVDPEMERVATERAVQQAQRSEQAQKWLSAAGPASSLGRRTADTITDDELDQLYARLAKAERAVNLLADSHRRAEQAEELLRIAHDTSNRSEAERARAVQRAERAEAELGDAWQKFANVCGQRDRLRLRMHTLADRWDLEGPPPGNRPLTELRAEISIEPLPELERAEAERDGAYRERAQLLALLASLHPSVIAPAPDVDEDGWQILYLRIGGRQASWHIAPRDAELYAHVQHVPVDDSRAQWDGHTTDEKYAHIGQHAAQLYADARGRAETPLGPGEAAIARVTRALPAVRRALDSLPARCRYHGEDTDPRRPTYGAEACCDTGIPAQRRRLAEQALTALANLETNA